MYRFQHIWPLLVTIVALVLPLPAYGQSPFGYIEEFDNDVDAYDPEGSGADDPGLNGLPPDGPSNPGPLPDWDDIRNGAGGVLEEIPSGFTGGGHPGVPSSSGSNLGVVSFYASDGPTGRIGRSTAFPGRFSFRVDVYTDSTVPTTAPPGPGMGSDITADFWWTNGVQSADGSSPYLTESGITGEVLDNGQGYKVWEFTTTGPGSTVYHAALDTWYTLEVIFESDANHQLQIQHKVWNQAHAGMPLWTKIYTAGDVFLGPHNMADVGGPRYSWFTYPDLNVSRIFIDRAGTARAIGLGDMDGDGDFDNFDIQPFELALTDAAAYMAMYGLTDYTERGDIDLDGDLDNFDIQPFEVLLTSGSPLLGAPVPEPGSALLLVVGVIALALANTPRWQVTSIRSRRG